VHLRGRNGYYDKGKLRVSDVELEAEFAVGPTKGPTLLAVKAYDLPRAVEAACDLCDRAVLCIQNGTGILELLPKGLAAQRAAVSVAAWRSFTEPRRAIWNSPMSVALDARDARSHQWEVYLASPWVTVRVVDDFEAELWRKVIINASLNAVSVASGMDCASLRTCSEQHKLLREIAGECRRLAADLGCVSLPSGERIVEEVLNQVGAFRPSTLQDRDRAQPLELPWLVDNVLRLAAECGVAMPTLPKTWRELASMCAGGEVT
jgi:2-dehydropantoate 2-reductase